MLWYNHYLRYASGQIYLELSEYDVVLIIIEVRKSFVHSEIRYLELHDIVVSGIELVMNFDVLDKNILTHLAALLMILAVLTSGGRL